MSCHWEDAIERNVGKTIAEAKTELQDAWREEFHVQVAKIRAEALVGSVAPDRNTLHVGVSIDSGNVMFDKNGKSFALVLFSCANVHPRTAALAVAQFSKAMREAAS